MTTPLDNRQRARKILGQAGKTRYRITSARQQCAECAALRSVRGGNSSGPGREGHQANRAAAGAGAPPEHKARPDWAQAADASLRGADARRPLPRDHSTPGHVRRSRAGREPRQTRGATEAITQEREAARHETRSEPAHERPQPQRWTRAKSASAQLRVKRPGLKVRGTAHHIAENTSSSHAMRSPPAIR